MYQQKLIGSSLILTSTLLQFNLTFGENFPPSFMLETSKAKTKQFRRELTKFLGRASGVVMGFVTCRKHG